MNSSVTFEGNVTRDPVLRFAGEIPVAEFGLAVNERIKRRGEYEDSTTFFTVTAFNKLAEGVAEAVAKGARVIVSGTLQTETWESDDGERSVLKIIANHVGLSVLFMGGESGGSSRPTKKKSSAGRPTKRVAPEPDEGFDEEPF